MLSIGEFSKICSVSAKTLRYYAVEQLETMLLIIRLKSYNFSLEEIKQILGSGELGGDKLYAALTRKREDMKKQLHEQEKSLHQLECDI